MPTYDVYLCTYASTVITVEAEDRERAEEKALVEGRMPTICAQCSGWGSNYNLEIGSDWEVSDVEKRS